MHTYPLHSPASLKTNQTTRRQVLSSVPSATALNRIYQSGEGPPDQPFPYLEEDEYDVGLCLPFNEYTFDLARRTPLCPPSISEDDFFNGPKTPMEELEDTEGRFLPAPLKVDHGVAVLEESVELHVPDVVTQA